MTLKAARDSSSSSDTPKAMPDFLGSRQWIRSFTAKSRRRQLGLKGEERHQMEKTERGSVSLWKIYFITSIVLVEQTHGYFETFSSHPGGVWTAASIVPQKVTWVGGAE